MTKLLRYKGILHRCWPDRLPWLIALPLAIQTGSVSAQTVSFSLSATSVSTSGWVNVAGDPSTGVRTATASGITLSSVATANWSPYGGNSAKNGSGVASTGYFPSTVMTGNWFQYNGSGRSLALYNQVAPQLQLSGLNPDSTYAIQLSGSDTSSLVSNPTAYTLMGAVNYGTRNLNVHSNSRSGVVFTGITPNSSGVVSIFVNASTGTDLAAISGVRVYPGTAGPASPTVTISTPASGSIWGEGVNISLAATATETGGTISKVAFYADTSLIATKTASPYIFSWADPAPGGYTITAIATDNSGTVNSVAISVGVRLLNYFWSTTGNIGNNADSTFLGNVDSVRLDFRTRNLQRMSIAAAGNVGIGTISPTAQLHATSSVRLAGLVNDSTSAYSLALVSDTSGNVAVRSAAALGQIAAGGLGITGTNSLTLGDSVSGSGPHNFTTDRHQYLAGSYYSIGGSVNDPVNAAGFRWYDNGDLVSGTTMVRSVNTQAQTGLRYFNKMGILELGASDRLDTVRSKYVTGSWQGSGLISNSDDSTSGGGRLVNTIFLADIGHVDTEVTFFNCLIAEEDMLIFGATSLSNSLLSGQGGAFGNTISNSIITGSGHFVALPANGTFIGGYANGSVDTADYSLIVGSNNQFGGLGQLEAGQFLTNRTPFGAALGNGNTDFTGLSLTHTIGLAMPGMAGYPLFAIGNSSTGGQVPSNYIPSDAVTVLYNGRTQINTTGYSDSLLQAAVTPKAALEVVSTTSGVLLPKLTTAQQNGITTTDLQNGLLLYNTDSAGFRYYNGSGWLNFGVQTGITSAGWSALGNAGTSSSTNFIGTVDTAQVVFRTNNTPQMTLFSTGGVGIGTSALPGSDGVMAVNGAIYSSKIVVTLTGWPDYVFDKGYRLPGLNGVAAYIQRNRHLPGVAAASEITRKGLDLGENQATLLRKVEELTLYLIEAHKQSDQRQQEIDQLNVQHKSVADHQQEIDQLKETILKFSSGK